MKLLAFPLIHKGTMLGRTKPPKNTKCILFCKPQIKKVSKKLWTPCRNFVRFRLHLWFICLLFFIIILLILNISLRKPNCFAETKSVGPKTCRCQGVARVKPAYRQGRVRDIFSWLFGTFCVKTKSTIQISFEGQMPF